MHGESTSGLPPKDAKFVKTIQHKKDGIVSKFKAWSMPSGKYAGHENRLALYTARAYWGLPLFDLFPWEEFHE